MRCWIMGLCWAVASLAAAGPKEYLIDTLTVEGSSLYVTATPSFHKKYCKENFYVHYDPDVSLGSLDYSQLSIPFVLSTIVLVWSSGKTYAIKSMDGDLYRSLKEVKEGYKLVYPEIAWTGELVPDKIVEHLPHQVKEWPIALTFSRGLDSTYTSLCHQDQKQLLMTILGFSDARNGNWATIRKQCTEYADQWGHKASFAESNAFYAFKLHHLHEGVQGIRFPTISSEIRRVGVLSPIILTQGAQTMYTSNSHSYQSGIKGWDNPLIINNIRFSGVQVRNQGFDKNTLGKMEWIIECCRQNSMKFPKLIMCRSGKHSEPCCRCMKCLRRLNHILAMGLEPQQFGFACTTEQVQKRTMHKLRPRKQGIIKEYPGEWYEVAEYIKKQEKTGMVLDPYLYWLSSVDFAAVILDIHKYAYFPNHEYREVFEEMGYVLP